MFDCVSFQFFFFCFARFFCRASWLFFFSSFSVWVVIVYYCVMLRCSIASVVSHLIRSSNNVTGTILLCDRSRSTSVDDHHIEIKSHRSWWMYSVLFLVVFSSVQRHIHICREILCHEVVVLMHHVYVVFQRHAYMSSEHISQMQ